MASFNRSDLDFVLHQILIAEAHAAGTPIDELIDSPLLSFGLRTVDGSFNNIVPGQENFGAADQLFPRMTDRPSALLKVLRRAFPRGHRTRRRMRRRAASSTTLSRA